jgi:YgiT-type zinc finger domain-containing protein
MMTPPFNESRWHQVTEEITVGMRDWRAQHPKATLREIEDELDRRWAQARARLLEDLALHSAAADWPTDEETTPPTCPECGTPLQRHGQRTRTLQTHGGHDVALTRTYGTCPQCGRGLFPPR